MPTIIYTIITGNYDTIKQPLVVEEGVQYYLFTNNPEIKDAGVWKVVQIPSEQWLGRTERENNILLSRKVKMLPHVYLPEECELSIYVDADMLIKESLTELLKDLREDTLFAACRHSYCSSVREEINDLKAKGMGILITDHNVRETLSITDRAYIMYKSQVLTEGSSEFLANDPEAKRIYLGESFRLD